MTNEVSQVVLESIGTADEVRVELKNTAKALTNGDVLVNGKADLYEGAQDHDGWSTFTGVVPRDSFLSQSFTVMNLNEGGDFAEIEINLNNSAV